MLGVEILELWDRKHLCFEILAVGFDRVKMHHSEILYAFED